MVKKNTSRFNDLGSSQVTLTHRLNCGGHDTNFVTPPPFFFFKRVKNKGRIKKNKNEQITQIKMNYKNIPR